MRKSDLMPVWDDFYPFGVGGNKIISRNVVISQHGSFAAAVDLETGKTIWQNLSHGGGQLPVFGDDTRMSVEDDGGIVLRDSIWHVVVDRATGKVCRAVRSR